MQDHIVLFHILRTLNYFDEFDLEINTECEIFRQTG